MRLAILLTFTICTSILHSQSTCETWQWTGTDSTNKTLARTDVLNEHGKVAKATWTGYQMQAYTIPDQVNFSTYRDTLATSWTSSTPDGDSTRIQYEYNEAGQCVHKNEYRFTHVTPDTGSTGMFTFTDVKVDNAEGKWILRTEGTYTYDRWGRKVMFTAITPEGKESQKHTWTYDKKGRIATQEFSTGGFTYRKDEYKYFKGGYATTMILYDDYGKPRHKLSPDSAMYRPLSISTYKLDDKGRKVEVRVTDDKKKQKSRQTFSYDSAGRQVRDVYYDAEDRVVVVHEYVWK